MKHETWFTMHTKSITSSAKDAYVRIYLEYVCPVCGENNEKMILSSELDQLLHDSVLTLWDIKTTEQCTNCPAELVNRIPLEMYREWSWL